MGKHVPLDCDWVDYAVPFRLDKNERKFYPVKILGTKGSVFSYSCAGMAKWFYAAERWKSYFLTSGP